MKNRVISMICLIALLLSMTTLGALSSTAATTLWIDKEPAKNVDYSFAVVGDIQTITYSDTHQGTRYVATLFEWLIQNQRSRRIEYVFGLGDTVETLTSYPESYNPSVNNPREWETASQSISMLNGIIPYSVVRGNHDDEGGYHKYICTDYYKSQMDKFYYDPMLPATAGNSMSNSYRKIDICGHKYLMLTLDFNITDGVKAWANELIAENPDYHVIVSIHSFLGNWGGIYNGAIGQANEFNVTEEIFFDGQALWDDVLSKHENVFMVLSGHISTDDPVVKTVRVGDNGNQIIDILVDPQSTREFDPTDPEGQREIPIYAILMLNFVNGGSEIKIDYVMPDRDKQLKAKNRFTIELPEGTLPEYVPVSAETEAPETTAAPETTTATEAPATTEESKGGCKGSIASTVTVCCAMGTALAAFAMRKRKED